VNGLRNLPPEPARRWHISVLAVARGKGYQSAQFVQMANRHNDFLVSHGFWCLALAIDIDGRRLAGDGRLHILNSLC